VQAAPSVGSHPLSSAETSKAWFRALPTADPKSAIDALSGALATLPAAAFVGAGADATLQSLETLRKPCAQLQEELSARYADKALPLSDTQRAAFESNVGLAQGLGRVYHSLIAASLSADGEFAERAALIHQRTIYWEVQSLIEHLRARQRFAETQWSLAQDALQSAGRHQLLERNVRDSQQPAGTSSVSATYARGLLLHLTGARSMTMREFECARELAHHFEGKAELSYIVADSLGVAASGNKGSAGDPVKVIQTGGLLHFLDIAALSKSLSRRFDALNHGRMFESPVLSTAPSQPALKALLSKLHGSWCARANQRQFPRRRRDEQIYCAFEPEAIHGLMKRRLYVAPPPAKLYDHTEVANIYLARDTAPPAKALDGHSPESWEAVRDSLEIWRSQEESATGMSLARVRGGARIRQGQLIALRLGDVGVAMVGVVRWAEQAESGEANASGDASIDPGHTLEIGVQMLPGLARAGAVRYIGAGAVAQAGAKAGSSAALILDNFSRDGSRDSGPNTVIPGAPAARPVTGTRLPAASGQEAADDARPTGPYRYSERATIVLPSGFSREGETIEFIDGVNSFSLRLGKLAHRHGDFDRMQFTMTE